MPSIDKLHDYHRTAATGYGVVFSNLLDVAEARLFQIVRVDDGVTLLRGGMRFACIEISTGKPRRLPHEFVEGYGPAVLKDQPVSS